MLLVRLITDNMSHTINTQVIEDLKQRFDSAEDLYDMELVMKETDEKGFTKEAEVMSHMIDYYKEKASDDADMAMDYYHGNA